MKAFWIDLDGYGKMLNHEAKGEIFETDRIEVEEQDFWNGSIFPTGNKMFFARNEPIGPFRTEAEALQFAQDSLNKEIKTLQDRIAFLSKAQFKKRKL